MIIRCTGLSEELKNGLIELCNHLGITQGEGGYVFEVTQKDGSDLIVKSDNKKVSIVYSEKCHFFRAFGLAVQYLREGQSSFQIMEKPHFRSNGPMFDMSQAGAAFNIKELKNIIRQLALMGLNTLMLYTEDNYEVEAQPYFGYMRPKCLRAVFIRG